MEKTEEGSAFQRFGSVELSVSQLVMTLFGAGRRVDKVGKENQCGEERKKRKITKKTENIRRLHSGTDSRSKFSPYFISSLLPSSWELLLRFGRFNWFGWLL